jgi:hypothetical protein
MRRGPWAWSCLTVVLVACGDDAGPAYEPPPAGCSVALWDPHDGELTRWPEPDVLVEDGATGTGWRLDFDPERYAPTLEAAGLFRSVFAKDLSDLDGFGVNSQAFFRFSEAFDLEALQVDEEAGTVTGLGLLVLEPGPPRVHPVMLRSTDGGATLMMVPRRPLPEQARVAAFATTDLAGAAGGCVWPSEAHFEGIHASDPETLDAVAALQASGVIDDPSDLVALSLFPTQTITDDSSAIAAHIADGTYALEGPTACEDDAQGRWRRCSGSFQAGDFRGPDGAIQRVPGDPVSATIPYALPFTVWLPPAGGGHGREPPYETILFGHGLGGDRFQAQRLAEHAAPLGIATIAVDAPQHGEHPTVPEDASTDTLPTVLRFFAVDVEGEGDSLLDALVLRDHWRQSTYDKLQLTRLLEGGLDVDAASPGIDLDPQRLAYLGVSLGGIMGAELSALTDTYGAVLLVVPGGRVSSIVSESETFGPLIPVLAGGRPLGDIERFFPVLQTILDRGDAASYGPHVLDHRLTGATVPPSVLVGVVLDDDTVPNVSNHTLARALGTPVVPPVRRPFPGMALADTAPLSGNIAGGAATAGLLQFDLVGDGEGGTRTATHSNVGASDVGAEAWLQFLVSHWDDGLAMIVDPYETLPLPRPD